MGPVQAHTCWNPSTAFASTTVAQFLARAASRGTMSANTQPASPPHFTSAGLETHQPRARFAEALQRPARRMGGQGGACRIVPRRCFPNRYIHVPGRICTLTCMDKRTYTCLHSHALVYMRTKNVWSCAYTHTHTRAHTHTHIFKSAVGHEHTQYTH